MAFSARDYSEWVLRCFRRDATPAQTSPDADPDGDAIPNAVEYALDLSPLRTDRSELPAGFVAVGPTQGEYHGVNYRRRIGTSDLHYDVQVSTNLMGWAGGATVEIQVTPLGDGMESASTRTLYTVSGLTNHFLRVRATLGP